MLVLMHGGLAPLIPNLSLRGEGDKRTVRSQEGKKVDAESRQREETS